ncbi:DUF6551 family protein [Aureimonas sp. SK2]|uniref:DUF6551 family protein n=1 Tax=Aureimonas sp. SK2 TaxID=3015992 RepID=UPI002444EAEC|nr:DUF6551 family protein [Aureimonas sp. SK2]
MAELRTITADLVKAVPAPALGAAPMLQWIDIAHLRADPRYQRDLRPDNVRAIQRIAESFDWSKFSAVHVAPIEGGLFAIIDGQHRTHAALACGLEKVPCLVTHMTLKQQASAFAAINGLATRVTPVQIFRAALAAEEAWALKLLEVCEKADCKAVTYNTSSVNKRPGDVFCITYLRTLIERRGTETTTLALTILRKTEGVGDKVEFYAYALFRPILEALASRPHALKNPQAAIDLLELFNFDKFERDVSAQILDARRKGEKAIGRVELMEAVIGTALDRGLNMTGAR